MMEAIKRILIADAGEDFRRGLVDSLSGEADSKWPVRQAMGLS